MTAAAEHQPQQDALEELLAGMEAEHGPVDEREVEQIMGRLVRWGGTGVRVERLYERVQFVGAPGRATAD